METDECRSPLITTLCADSAGEGGELLVDVDEENLTGTELAGGTGHNSQDMHLARRGQSGHAGHAMNETPLISVITPAYNVGKYIGEAVDSVLAQTEGRFEYLIVDDGSTDDTVEVVRKRMEVDDRLRLVPGEHRGSSAARNVGLREVKGRYVAFLDGDDRWDAEFLQKMVAAIEAAPDNVGVVFCQGRIIDDSGRAYWRRNRPARDYDMDDMLVYDNPLGNGSLLLAKSSVFEEVGIFDEDLQSAVDLEMWLRIGHKSSTPIFRGIKDALIDIRVRPGAMSRDSSTRLNAIQEILDTWVPRLRPENQARAFVRPAVVAFRVGDDVRAEKWAAQAMPAGKAWMLRDGYGPRMLGWNLLARKQRSMLRALLGGVKSLIIKVILGAVSFVGRLLERRAGKSS
jgi:glycosyltransferase involved in cell wall biosynthesis